MFHKSNHPLGLVEEIPIPQLCNIEEISGGICGKLRGNCGKRIFPLFVGQHNYYKGYILKLQDFLPKK
jgi:hypothetical protein